MTCTAKNAELPTEEEHALAISEHFRNYGAHRASPLGVAEFNLARELASLQRTRSPRNSHRARKPTKTRPSRPCREFVPGGYTGTCATCGWAPGQHHRSRKPTKAKKRDETAAIWEACWARCGGYCECGCGRMALRETGDLNSRAELEHPFSKGKGARLPQSVETCWILRADCHRDRHAARPGAEAWWEKFIAHCERQMARSNDINAGFDWYEALSAGRNRLVSWPFAEYTRHRWAGAW